MKPQFALPSHQNDRNKRVAYINARLFDPASGLDAKGSLLTIGDSIADFGPHLTKDKLPEGCEIIDCGGQNSRRIN